MKLTLCDVFQCYQFPLAMYLFDFRTTHIRNSQSRALVRQSQHSLCQNHLQKSFVVLLSQDKDNLFHQFIFQLNFIIISIDTVMDGFLGMIQEKHPDIFSHKPSLCHQETINLSWWSFYVNYWLIWIAFETPIYSIKHSHPHYSISLHI